MTAYVVFIKEQTINQSELDVYSASVASSFRGHEVKVLAAYGTYEVLEGPAMEGAVMLEFESIDAAQAWYRSPAYQAVAQHRFKGAAYRGFIIQGR
jgi:uncharacterized protein (DUF1330 family)